MKKITLQANTFVVVRVAAAFLCCVGGLARASYAQTPVTPAPPPAPPTAEPSDSENHHKFSFGPEVGVYLPSTAKVRDTFGGSWFSFGLGIGRLNRPSVKGKFEFDIGFYGNTKGGGRQALFLPVGVDYRRALNRSRDATPYVGLGADFVASQLRSDPDGLISRVRGSYAGSAFAGLAFREKGYIQARYFLMDPTRGYNLSGLSLAAGFRF